MSLRFFRRVPLAPGIALTSGESAESETRYGSFRRGVKVRMGKTGLRRTEKTSAAGVEYTEHARWSGGSTSGGSPSEERASEAESGGSVENGAEDGAKSSAPADMGGVEKRLHIGFFRRLFTPEHEMALVEGLKEFVAGGEEDAVERLAGAPNLADARYIAGFLSIKLDRLQEAAEHLQAAAASGDRLGSYLNKYGLSLTFFLPVTEHVRACITPSVRGALLALTECQQELGCLTEATDTARELVDTDREDPAALLSLVELRSRAEGRDELEEVIRLTTGVENVSELHAALLYYKGKTLHRLGMPAAARDALSAALRRKKNRSEELLRAACYERALVYEELGNTAREKEELEKIYAEAPDYMDVAERLSA